MYGMLNECCKGYTFCFILTLSMAFINAVLSLSLPYPTLAYPSLSGNALQ